jgi:hypothetical protein
MRSISRESSLNKNGSALKGEQPNSKLARGAEVTVSEFMKAEDGE